MVFIPKVLQSKMVTLTPDVTHVQGERGKVEGAKEGAKEGTKIPIRLHPTGHRLVIRYI